MSTFRGGTSNPNRSNAPRGKGPWKARGSTGASSRGTRRQFLPRSEDADTTDPRPRRSHHPSAGPRHPDRPRDASYNDAGRRDKGYHDAGSRDTGSRDTGSRDARPRDTGYRGAGSRDARQRDTGQRDAGYGGARQRGADYRDAPRRHTPDTRRPFGSRTDRTQPDRNGTSDRYDRVGRTSARDRHDNPRESPRKPDRPLAEPPPSTTAPRTRSAARPTPPEKT